MKEVGLSIINISKVSCQLMSTRTKRVLSIHDNSKSWKGLGVLQLFDLLCKLVGVDIGYDRLSPVFWPNALALQDS
jgi:hypothetical protein